MKVVVVDNNASVREAMRALLDRWGCEMHIFSGLADVEAAIAADPGFRPDVILADFHLDDGDCGLSAVKRLRETGDAALNAIVITGDHSDEVADAVAAAGCEILRKPVKPAELRALITHLVG
jgi:CheY-like chemotaxis protein